MDDAVGRPLFFKSIITGASANQRDLNGLAECQVRGVSHVERRDACVMPGNNRCCIHRGATRVVRCWSVWAGERTSMPKSWNAPETALSLVSAYGSVSFSK